MQNLNYVDSSQILEWSFASIPNLHQLDGVFMLIVLFCAIGQTIVYYLLVYILWMCFEISLPKLIS